MRIPMILAATLAVLTAGAPALAAPAIDDPNAAPAVQTPGERLDKSGKCAGPDGKDATAPACKGAGPAPAVGGASASAGDVYRLDAKGVCRDSQGKKVKADLCKP